MRTACLTLLLALGCSSSEPPPDAAADTGSTDTSADTARADAPEDAGADAGPDGLVPDVPSVDAAQDASGDRPCAPACPTGQVCLGGTCYAPTDAGVDAPDSPATDHYQVCQVLGALCRGGTTCTAALARGAATPQGNTCTQACPTGLASSCPGFVQGQVECVQVGTNPRQCVRLCTRAEDCAPFGTQCLQVSTGATTSIRLCVP